MTFGKDYFYIFHQENRPKNMFRHFFDTSFNDYRQVRIVLQELPENRSREPSEEFQR